MVATRRPIGSRLGDAVYALWRTLLVTNLFLHPGDLLQLTDDVMVTSHCHPSYYHFPECIDHPDGYGCECGPGFRWNTYMCVASGLDSRLEFAQQVPLRYTLLLNKPFPEMTSFTIALWVRLWRPQHPSTVLSYTSHDGRANVLRVTAGPWLTMGLQDEEITTNLMLNGTEWTHLAWTWTSTDGSWRLYINGGRLVLKGRAPRADRPIHGGGELVLGQASRTPESQNYFDPDQAYLGDMAFVNIWHGVMTLADVRSLYRDCPMMHCGDAVEWGDFRSGTRGDMRIRWPSEIFSDGPCFSERTAALSCDRYCSHVIGAQCNAETRENIRWERTPADHDATVRCPGEVSGKPNATATRECVRTSDNDGVWGEPVLGDCTTLALFEAKTQAAVLREQTTGKFNETDIFMAVSRLANISAHETLRNPVDIAAVIDTMSDLVRTQELCLRRILSHSSPYNYGIDRDRDRSLYPSLLDTQRFIKAMLRTTDSVTHEKNEAGWLASLPPGSEGDALVRTLGRLDDLAALSLRFHVARADVNPEEAVVYQRHGRLVYQIHVLPEDTWPVLIFPNSTNDVTSDVTPGVRSPDRAIIPTRALIPDSGNSTPELITVSVGRFLITKLLPNHNLTRRSKEDNVNTAVFYVNAHAGHDGIPVPVSDVTNASEPITLRLNYIDDFNISNPVCVNLVTSHGGHSWNWTRDRCKVLANSSYDVTCQCIPPGIFAATTYMYNVDWDPGEEPIVAMEIPSYIGCCVSATLCLFSVILLFYFRTTSKTAAIHKNFAVAIIGSQVIFMAGIDRTEHQALCHAFAIAFHYFFLATFSWLMNEAFNLYIVITYAAHSHGELTEGGSQWRYYILGWILPGVLVGVFVGTHVDDYYATDLCWIAEPYIWLFLGPAIGIITVTILVLIFTAKEHHESSYCKNERTNKAIIVYSKALWTQVILITIGWCFAFLSIKMRGVIIKYLYGLFNGLQGAFFLVFYFLLNEEVRAVYQSWAKKKNKSKQGFDSSEGSDEDSSMIPTHENARQAHQEMQEMEVLELPQIPESSGSGAPTRARLRKPSETNFLTSSSEGDEEEEHSGCEMIVTSV